MSIRAYVKLQFCPHGLYIAFGHQARLWIPHIMHHTCTSFNTHSYENPIKIGIFVRLLLGSRTITSTSVFRFSSPHIKARRHQFCLHPKIEPTHFALFAAHGSHRAYPASLLAALGGWSRRHPNLPGVLRETESSDSSNFLSHLFSSLWHTCCLCITSHFVLHQRCNRPSATHSFEVSRCTHSRSEFSAYRFRMRPKHSFLQG